MAIERTLSIIKPDATRRNLTGQINAALEGATGLRIIAQKRMRLTKAQAEAFYAVHKERSVFFRGASGRIHDLRASGRAGAGGRECGGEEPRDVMGATDPEEGRTGYHPREVR